MKYIYSCLLATALAISTLPLRAEEEAAAKPAHPKTEADIVMYDDIIIDRPVDEVWTQVLNFIHWYFEGQKITHLSGQYGQPGYTLRINDDLLHQAINVRPGKSIVWKTCYIATCQKDVVFTDFEITRVEGKTLFSRRSYSQNFWAKPFADALIAEISAGKVPNTVRMLSKRFKHYVESEEQANKNRTHYD